MTAAKFFHNELYPFGYSCGVDKINSIPGCEKAIARCQKDAKALSFYSTAAIVAALTTSIFAGYLVTISSPATFTIAILSGASLIGGAAILVIKSGVEKLALKINLYKDHVFDPTGRVIAFTKKYWKPVGVGLAVLEGVSLLSHLIKKHA